jgi:hypothetical protein
MTDQGARSNVSVSTLAIFVSIALAIWSTYFDGLTRAVIALSSLLLMLLAGASFGIVITAKAWRLIVPDDKTQADAKMLRIAQATADPTPAPDLPPNT